MIPELGHFALAVALAISLLAAVVPMIGAQRGNVLWMSLARPAARAQLVFTALAFAALAHGFVTNDFSVAYVANNSNSALPLAFRISALWGAHEGSLLLWVLLLSAWSCAVSFACRGLPLAFVARVLAVMAIVSVGFLLFMLVTSNPFLRQLPPPLDGADLNPLLQDFGLVIHPPMLYTGYVGFSVAFSFAVAGLIGGHLDSAWARWARPWTLLAWCFLTLGIALGSWWAYYELGWGGWWFWDPVENASFMPWLLGTALIHSLAATEKRDVFKSWTVLLAIGAFGLSLLGTFLVRSGVLTSVHAFASDPARGVFILAFLVLIMGGALALYAWRGASMGVSASYATTSRETFLLANSVLLTVACATVLLGTLYPLVLDALNMGKISVGPPYFNSVFIPVMTPLVVLLGLGQHARWKQERFATLCRELRVPLIGALLLLAAAVAAMSTARSPRAIFGLALAAWVIATTVAGVVQRCRGRQAPWRAFFTLPAAYLGQHLAHLGFAVTIIGVTLVSLNTVDLHTRMAPGDELDVAAYHFKFVAALPLKGPNYDGTEAQFEITRPGQAPLRLSAEKRNYRVRAMPMTEAGIDAGLTRDLYISLGEPLDGAAWSVRLSVKPFVRWLWLGAILMAAGGFTAMLDPRFRRVSARRAARSDNEQRITS